MNLFRDWVASVVLFPIPRPLREGNVTSILNNDFPIYLTPFFPSTVFFPFFQGNGF